MSGTLLVRGARQLITLRGPAEPRRGAALSELGMLRDGALLIEDGLIVQVGLSRRVENLAVARRSQEIDASGRVVMPGFVDSHTRVVWGSSHLDEAGAVQPAVPQSEMRNSSAKRLASRARHLINTMVRHGTTSLEAVTGYGLDARTELKILRVHALLARAPIDIVSTFLPPEPEVCAELLPLLRRKGNVRFAGLDCEAAMSNMEAGRRYLQAARDLRYRLKIQAGRYNTREAVRLAVEMGAAGIDDLTEAGRQEIDLLARSATMAVLFPGSCFGPGESRLFARQLIDGGGALALGSGFHPGMRSTASMPFVIALACSYLGMTPAEAICAATHNAACAIGSEGVAGSLEVGKAADLIVLNVSDYREIPQHFGLNLVNRTVKRGAVIYQEGKVAGV